MSGKNGKNNKTSRYITTREAAERLGVSLDTIRRWIKQGKLRGKKIVGRWKVLAEDVEKLEN